MLTPTNAWYKVACIAENIKANDHYICDKKGHILCLPGWQNEKHYCREPICDPACVAGQGNCTRPNHCECGIGWTHSDCSKCVCLPGCVNGYCQTPFECKCEPGWTGMFCDKPICKEGCQHGHCSIPGECICHPGWFGPNCDQCVKLPGCTYNGFCTKPMECQCKPGWTGHFCHKPICRPGCNETTGFCSKPGECWCRVGWTGPKCETCVPYPGCQNGFCEQPWECKCTGDYVGMLCDKLASETTTVQYHPTTLPPIPPQNTGQPFTIIQGANNKFNKIPEYFFNTDES